MSRDYNPGGLPKGDLAVTACVLGAGESPEAVEGLPSCHRVCDAQPNHDLQDLASIHRSGK